jgi:hypothetical protein
LRKDEQRRVGLGGDKTKLIEMLTQTSIPSTGRLLQPVKRSLKLANMQRVTRILKKQATATYRHPQIENHARKHY